MTRTAARTDHTPRYSDADLAPMLKLLVAVRDGDLRPFDDIAADGSIAKAVGLLNEIRERGELLTGELSRVRGEIGREGHLRERLKNGPTIRGAWGAAGRCAASCCAWPSRSTTWSSSSTTSPTR